MNSKSLVYFILFLFGAIQFSVAQQSKDTIRPDRLIITKQYTPTVSKASKLKFFPEVDADTKQQQYRSTYPLVNYPVASTFSPEKGRPANLNKNTEKTSFFDNYARVGLGNFTTLLGEFYGKLDLNNKQKLSISAYHRSSQGGIDEVDLDDSFSVSNLRLNLSTQEDYFSWETYVGVKSLRFNYYGNPQLPLVQEDLSSFDSSIGYFGFDAGGKLAVEDSFFNLVNVDYSYFGDRFSNNEHHISILPEVEYSLINKNFDTQFKFDYLSGGFSETYNNPNTVTNYGFLQLAVAPTMRIDEDRFTVHVGAEVAYLSDTENSTSNVFVYPKIRGSYRINQDNLIAYGGVDGGLDNNSYANATMTNPFLSPTLLIAPTNRQYDAFLGFKGGEYGWSYNTKASFKSEENRAMFATNFLIGGFSSEGLSVYRARNSFGLVYDNLTSLAFDVEIDYELSKQVKAGVHFNYTSFSADFYREALNLPSLYTSAFVNYKWSDKITSSLTMFYVGERYDLARVPSSGGFSTIKVEDFFDFNLQVNYAINKQFAAFLSGMNLLGGNYQRWNNYVVQDIQIMGGVSYQFDW